MMKKVEVMRAGPGPIAKSCQNCMHCYEVRNTQNPLEVMQVCKALPPQAVGIPITDPNTGRTGMQIMWVQPPAKDWCDLFNPVEESTKGN